MVMWDKTYDWEMFVDGLGTDGAVTNSNLGEVDWWVRHTEIGLRDIGLRTDMRVDHH